MIFPLSTFFLIPKSKVLAPLLPSAVIYRLTLKVRTAVYETRIPKFREWCEIGTMLHRCVCRRTPSVYLAEPSTRLAFRCFFTECLKCIPLYLFDKALQLYNIYHSPDKGQPNSF